METLQKEIEKRAEKRLKEDLKFLTLLHSKDGNKYYHMFKDIFINIGTQDNPTMVNPTIIFKTDSRIYKEAFEKNLPSYIKDETTLFLKEVNDLKERIKNMEEELQHYINYTPE